MKTKDSEETFEKPNTKPRERSVDSAADETAAENAAGHQEGRQPIPLNASNFPPAIDANKDKPSLKATRKDGILTLEIPIDDATELKNAVSQMANHLSTFGDTKDADLIRAALRPYATPLDVTGEGQGERLMSPEVRYNAAKEGGVKDMPVARESGQSDLADAVGAGKDDAGVGKRETANK